MLSLVVDERLVCNLGQKLNLADLSRLFRNLGCDAPFFLDRIHASLSFLKFGVGFLLTLPLGWNIVLFVSRCHAQELIRSRGLFLASRQCRRNCGVGVEIQD